MSILLGSEIRKEYKFDRRIIIEPFNESQLGPNSYDVTLNNLLRIYKMKPGGNLDFKQKNETEEILIPPGGIVLQPGQLYLGSTNEKCGSDFFVPMYEGRSSLARLGVQSHISAGFGDIGFKDRWTLEIQVTLPVRIYPNIRIGQIYFHRVNTIALNTYGDKYSGKYVGQTDAQPSKSYEDKI
jgi:dCTP deaminase